VGTGNVIFEPKTPSLADASYSITLVCSLEIFSEAIENALGLIPDISNASLKRIDSIIDIGWDWIVDGDLRPTGIANKFNLFLVPKIRHQDFMFFGALRARDVDSIVAHLIRS
jgi:hypothetical protein